MHKDAYDMTQCTMAQALKKFGIKDLAKIMTLALIFSSQNYFRLKYLEALSFTQYLTDLTKKTYSTKFG